MFARTLRVSTSRRYTSRRRLRSTRSPKTISKTSVWHCARRAKRRRRAMVTFTLIKKTFLLGAEEEVSGAQSHQRPARRRQRRLRARRVPNDRRRLASRDARRAWPRHHCERRASSAGSGRSASCNRSSSGPSRHVVDVASCSALQWANVISQRRWLRVRAETAKDDETRDMPISSVSQHPRHAEDGSSWRIVIRHRRTCSASGSQVKSVKRAWTRRPQSSRHTPSGPERCQAHASRARRSRGSISTSMICGTKAASRLLEAGWPLHHIQEMLGHASMEQT